jgi:hypothetical protein
MDAILVLLVLVVLAGTAAAQPRGDVNATFQAGVDAYRLGKYAEAKKLLERARTMEPTLPGPHRFLAAVAQAEQRFDDCVTSAREAMRLKPDSTEIAATRTLHDACRAAAGRQAFDGNYGDGGAIAVTANIDGATVSVAGLRYGGTPLAPRALPAGSAEVIVEKTGWKRAVVQVEILPGVVTDVAVTLEAEPVVETGGGGVDPTTHGWLVIGAGVPGDGAATMTIDGTAVAIAEEVPLEGGVHEIVIEAPGRERWRRRVRITRGQKARVAVAMPIAGERARKRRVAMYVLAGAGVAAVGGMVGAVMSSRAAEEARDIWRIETSRPPAVPLDESGMIEPVRTRADLEDARDRARTWSIVSLAGYGVAIAGAGVGAYLLVRQQSAEVEGKPAPFANVVPVVGPDRVGAVVEVAW